MGDGFITRVEDVSSVKGYVCWVKFNSACAAEVSINVESVVIWWVISVHSSDLGEMAEYFRIVRKLMESFARFGGGWVECYFAKGAVRVVRREVLSPLFLGV